MSIQTECQGLELELSRLTASQLAELRASVETIARSVKSVVGIFSDEGQQQRIGAHFLAMGPSLMALMQIGIDPVAKISDTVRGFQRLQAVFGETLALFKR